jgi:hypothetical protein
MTEYKRSLTKIKPYAKFDETLETVDKYLIGDYTDERIKGIAEHIRESGKYDYFTIEKRELHESNEKLSIG